MQLQPQVRIQRPLRIIRKLLPRQQPSTRVLRAVAPERIRERDRGDGLVREGRETALVAAQKRPAFCILDAARTAPSAVTI